MWTRDFKQAPTSLSRLKAKIKFSTSVSDPNPDWIRSKFESGSGSEGQKSLTKIEKS